MCVCVCGGGGGGIQITVSVCQEIFQTVSSGPLPLLLPKLKWWSLIMRWDERLAYYLEGQGHRDHYYQNETCLYSIF